MALRVPEPKMLDVTPAGRIGSVVARVALRGRAEQVLPTPAAVQLVAVLHGMACLMAKNGHALGPGAALDVEHHFLLDLHQAGMGEIEWDGNAGHICRTKPFARYPCVWPQPDAPLFELLIESRETILEPSAFDRNLQTTEAVREQLLIRQFFPSIFPARHRASRVHDNYLDVVIGCCRQQPPRLRDTPLSGGPRRLRATRVCSAIDVGLSVSAMPPLADAKSPDVLMGRLDFGLRQRSELANAQKPNAIWHFF